MSNPAIIVDGISKQYRIGVAADRYPTFREAIVGAVKAPIRRWRRLREHGNGEDTIWALKDVSFEVQPGEVVGIIGRNGAGKTTLLKILSRITEPTEGVARLRGRVASLLEVGTGFHPELTGRENIYLNGAILGMKKAEIDGKFDGIVAFSGIAKFLDTPVKRYSSGMYVRLAFAVAAHLEPEILIVDEVLAVGDAEFQRKCLGRMKDVAAGGRTVLFVSHNMTAVRILCSRAVYLEGGRIVEDGDTPSVIGAYLTANTRAVTALEMELREWPIRKGTGEAKIVHARLLDEHGEVTGTFYRLKPMVIEFTFESQCRAHLILSAICMTLGDGTKVLQLAHQDTPSFTPGVVKGRKTVRIEIPSLPLQCGEYDWALAIHTESISPVDVVYGVLPFTVDDDLTSSPRPYRSMNEHGLCTLLANWQYANSEDELNALK